MLQRVRTHQGKSHFRPMRLNGPHRSKRALLLIKRISDILLSTALLLLFIPLALVLAVRIRMDGRRVIAQGEEVVGRGGRIFKKWRWGETRRTDAAWLAKELGFVPALINVLAGHMTIVGPMARSPRQYKALGFLTPDYVQLLSMRPGLIRVSDTRGARTQIEQELNYISNWTIVNDIKITCHRAILYPLEVKVDLD